MPTISPTAPDRTIRFVNVGLDAGGIEGSVPRVITFNVDGQSLISAKLSGVTGSVRVCIWVEATDDQRVCRTLRNGGVDKAVLGTDSSIWHVSLIGPTGFAPPTASLTVHFNANSPSVSLDNFRYLGTSYDSYNGFDVQVPTMADGQLGIQAAFDGGDGSYNYHLVIGPTGGSPLLDQTAGPSQSLDQTQSVSGGTSYAVSLHNPDAISNMSVPVFVAATITWP